MEQPEVHQARELNADVDSDIRYLMAVLALVNYPHTIVERDQIDTKLRSMAWGQRVPRNEVRLLDIDLPKPRGSTRWEDVQGRRLTQASARQTWALAQTQAKGWNLLGQVDRRAMGRQRRLGNNHSRL